ncbi:MAG: rod shape-determining protein MreD [Actinomycetota bacterium]|nr:rod shape-determining protein MreD [Actinomycetota bacterium]
MTARLGLMAMVLLTALLLDTVVLPGLSVAGWRPGLVILSVVAFALADGRETGACYGFAAGLVTDLLAVGDSVVGLWALVLLGVGYGVGRIRPYLAGTAAFGEIAVSGLATACALTLYGLAALLLDREPFSLVDALRAAVVVGLFNGLLAPLLVRPVRALSRRVGASLTGA